MSDDDRKNEQPPHAPLNYRDWRNDAPLRGRFRVDMFGGCVLGGIAVAINGANAVLSNLHYTSATQPQAWETNQLDWRGPFNCSIITLLAVASLAYLAFRRGRRGFVIGVLLGIGVMCLVEGLCFVKNLN